MVNLALCAALALAAGGAFAQDWESVRFGVGASYPPFESTAPSGGFVGFEGAV
ncbi:ABC transporter substrate-binding protein, partial [Burkholderia pseudomallei]